MKARVQSKRVDSSAILTVGYDARNRLLKVRFRSGRAYYYVGVPNAVYRRLLASESMGRFINDVIKPAYRAVRL